MSPGSIANQVKRQAEGFISTYYKSLMMCDDETCKYTTRSLNLRVIGDSERGTVCPNYPRCNGRLARKLPVQFGGPNPQLQSQGMVNTSLPMPLPMENQSQVQQQVFGQGLQPHNNNVTMLS